MIWTLRIAHLYVAEHNVALAAKVLSLEWNEAIRRDKRSDDWLSIDPPADRLEAGRCSCNVRSVREYTRDRKDGFGRGIEKSLSIGDVGK